MAEKEKEKLASMKMFDCDNKVEVQEGKCEILNEVLRKFDRYGVYY